tara:strand:- start:2990 stop:3637 length:648 start_codon:yes stop_codon:yes gene_type:complete
MAFKLGKSSRKPIASGGMLKSVPVYKKNLEKGILGEAYNDGTIAVSKDLKEGSKQYNDVVKHEMDHAKRMKTGELGYGDDWVRWKGKTYTRKDGKIKYNGKWMVEGHRDFPWEKIADKTMSSKRPDKKHDNRPTSAAFQSSALKRHNDINPGDPRHEEFHYKDKNGDWQPKNAMHMEINKLMPEMSELDVLKVIKSSAGDPDAIEKIKKRKNEIK